MTKAPHTPHTGRLDVAPGAAVAAAPSPPGGYRKSLALFATRAFRYATTSVAAIVVSGAFIVWMLFEATNDMISRQVLETIRVEAEGIAAIAAVGGSAAVVDVITSRAKAGGERLYLLESVTGVKRAGNLVAWPAEVFRGGQAGSFNYRTANDDAGNRLAAGLVVALAGDMRLLLARDLEPQRRLAASVKWLFLSGFGALTLAGLLAGLFASRAALGRVAEITRASDTIMAGDFTGRIPMNSSGSGNSDEFDHLARNLNAMLDRIELLMASLKEVSDNIAHDLKTPLSRLRSRAEAALRDVDQPQACRDGLGQVIEDADELMKTFNALLSIARLEAGAVEGTMEAFDPADLVRDVAELYAPVADEAGLALSCEISDGLSIKANRQLIGQAVANMIDNAIKYGGAGRVPSRPGKTIEVTLSRRGNDVLIAVGDHGPGIPAVDRERVLKRFVRLEPSRTQPGTGLGLSLVAAVARLHGGTIELEDNTPGLRIVLALPSRA